MRNGSGQAGDLTVVRRAGRIVAIQASVALAAVLILVGAVVAFGFLRAQSRQITDQLSAVAMSADDVEDPPPGMELVMRTVSGAVASSHGGKAGLPLLSSPAGFTDLHDKDRHYRALVADRPEGRVVALMDLAPYGTSRARLFGALALAEVTGIIASIVVVVLFTRRSVRPLTQALALQRRFVADASHELRAPLTVLHTRAQLLATRLHSGDVGAATRDADAVVADTRALSGVVDDLLASATMATGGPGGERVDVAAVSHAVCESMGPHAESVGVSLSCDVRDPGGLEVLGTEAALRRALTSLVDNAIAHQNDGGRVELVAFRDGQQVIVSVADNGVGIDDAAMATLFNRFSRGDAHTNRAGRQSYGIGLALVREIVEAHGGEISVHSVPGRGATFTIALPAAPR
ncbi:MAG: sensor histidine kinase [Mycobacterium sp.]